MNLSALCTCAQHTCACQVQGDVPSSQGMSECMHREWELVEVSCVLSVTMFAGDRGGGGLSGGSNVRLVLISNV